MWKSSYVPPEKEQASRLLSKELRNEENGKGAVLLVFLKLTLDTQKEYQRDSGSGSGVQIESYPLK